MEMPSCGRIMAEIMLYKGKPTKIKNVRKTM